MSVFVVHSVPTIDITAALAYGDLKYVNSRYVYADELVEDQIPAPFVTKIAKAATEFVPASDFLLIAGDHLQLIALSSLLAIKHSKYRVLRYDREAKGYFPVLINVKQ